METTRANRWDVLLSVVLGLLAFVVYLMTLAVGAFPGEFSAILTQSAGLFPRLGPDYPLWFGLGKGLQQLHAADPAAPFNIASAVAGGMSVGLVCLVMIQLILGVMREDEDNDTHARSAARLAGAGAALTLAFCIPFWVVSTRCHWAGMHVALFLLTTHVFLRAVFGGTRWTVLLFGLLYGVGVVEYPTMMVFGPLYAIVLLLALHHREELEFRNWAPGIAGFIAGLSLYGIAVWCFVGTPGYALCEYHGFYDVLWALWRNQWLLLSRSLPSQGWLVVLVVTILPAVVALLVARRALNAEHDWTYYVLHVVLTLLAVVVILNAFTIGGFQVAVSPWALMGYRRILVMPYVLLAALVGYLLAYWYLLPAPWLHARSRGIGRAVRHIAGPVMVAAGFVLLGVTVFRNLPLADGRASTMIRQVAAETVRCLDGRTWLVTDGSLDGALLVEARRQGVALRLIDLNAEQSPIMKRYIASAFTNSRMQNLALLGTHTMLRSWIEQDAGTLDRVATMVNPNLWSGAGYQAIPNGLIFLGARTGSSLDPVAMMGRHRELWKGLLAIPHRAVSGRIGPLDMYWGHIRRQAGIVANNLGVLMEDHGRKTEAYEAYTMARTFVPQNSSALMNQYTMVQQGFPASDAEAVRKDLAAWGQSIEGHKPKISTLMQRHGDVRSPMSFASLGYEWAMAGQPELAASGLRRAMGLVPEKGRKGYKQALAGLYLMQNQDDESEALFYELLVENPANQTALLGMARIEQQRDNSVKARDYLVRAAQAGVPGDLMNLEWAAFYVSTDDLKQAKALLRKTLEKQPDLIRALAMLTTINIQERDALGLVDTIRGINRAKQGNAELLSIANGYLAIMQDDLGGASIAFEKALAMRPGDKQLLEWLVRLDILQGQTEPLERRLNQLLRVDPSNAQGNFLLAAIQSARGESALARDSLMESLKTQRTPEALNDLAWLLQESGLYKEAEAHARAALEMRADIPQIWDTLGTILFKTDRLEESRTALEKALALEADSIPIILHLAELDLKQGRRDVAVRRLDELTARRSDMSTADREALDDLQRQL